MLRHWWVVGNTFQFDFFLQVEKIKKEDLGSIPVEKSKAKIVEKVKAFGAGSSDEEEEEVI